LHHWTDDDARERNESNDERAANVAHEASGKMKSYRFQLASSFTMTATKP
jgi:hypothetical protein